MSNEDIQSLQKVVDEQIQENMGMSMIYTIVSAAQEWMQEKVSAINSHEQDLALNDAVFKPGAAVSLPELAAHQMSERLHSADSLIP